MVLLQVTYQPGLPTTRTRVSVWYYNGNIDCRSTAVYNRKLHSYLCEELVEQVKRYVHKIVAILHSRHLLSSYFVLRKLRLSKMKPMFFSQSAALIRNACCFNFHCPFITKFTRVQTWVATMQLVLFCENISKALRETGSSEDFSHSSTYGLCIFHLFISG